MQELKKAFESYFLRKISADQLTRETGMNQPGFSKALCFGMKNCIETHDSTFLGYLVFGAILWVERYPEQSVIELAILTDTLNDLLVADWHQKHEDIVWLLQKIQSKSSIKYLYRAIHLELLYLDWDENYAFPKKCVRAIARIGGTEAIDALKQLCSDNNPAISTLAKRKLTEIVD